MKISFLHLAAAVLLFSRSQAVADGSVIFENLTSFDYFEGDSTFAAGINERGEIAGSYEFSSANFHGFIRFRDRWSEPIINPNSGGNNSTHLTDVNDVGTSCGYYFNGSRWTGFIDSNGTFRDVSTGSLDNYLTGINTAGNMCGYSANPESAFVIIDGNVTAFWCQDRCRPAPAE